MFFFKKSFKFSVFFLFLPFFAFSSDNFSDKKLLPRSEIFFTQMENCYELSLVGVEPKNLQIELPDLPSGVKFSSSKKEEFVSERGERGTLLSLWFTFSESGESHIPPLFAKINGKNHYFEFESVFVHENPALISPKLEIDFKNQKNLTAKNTYTFKKGEKITFLLNVRYAVQILSFKWTLPKDSIFREVERADFANGKQKLTEFSYDTKNLARFEWQILKSGAYSLPEITVEAVTFNGEKRVLEEPKNVKIIVTNQNEPSENKALSFFPGRQNDIFENAFKNPDSENEPTGKKQINLVSEREKYEKLAKNTRLSFFEKHFGKKQAIFAGGQVKQVPEDKAVGQKFEGGEKVKIKEKTAFWSFVEGEQFSGWTKNDNLIELE